MCVGVCNLFPEEVCLTKIISLYCVYAHRHKQTRIYIHTRKKKYNQTKIRNKQHSVHYNKYLFIFLKTSNNSTIFFKKKIVSSIYITETYS